VSLRIAEEIIEHDRCFRRCAKVHPEHVHIHGSQRRELGEGIYTLYTQNMWPEITGLSVWRVSPTYWSH
jgi:hypothetical protein